MLSSLLHPPARPPSLLWGPVVQSARSLQAAHALPASPCTHPLAHPPAHLPAHPRPACLPAYLPALQLPGWAAPAATQWWR
jgi:hypothetical protein